MNHPVFKYVPVYEGFKIYKDGDEISAEELIRYTHTLQKENLELKHKLKSAYEGCRYEIAELTKILVEENLQYKHKLRLENIWETSTSMIDKPFTES